MPNTKTFAKIMQIIFCFLKIMLNILTFLPLMPKFLTSLTLVPKKLCVAVVMPNFNFCQNYYYRFSLHNIRNILPKTVKTKKKPQNYKKTC